MLFAQAVVGSLEKTFKLEIGVCTQRKAPLLELLEAHPFLLAHLPRHPSLVRLYYYSCCPIIRHDILGLVDLSR